MATSLFSGIIPALLTPFDDEEQLDTAPVGSLVDRLIEQGIGGLFACGSTGEWYALSSEERMRMAEATMEAVNGRTKVMVHVGSFATSHAIALARHAEKIGADAISVLPPIGRPVPTEAMWDHFREIGAACGLPLYLYHVPQAYGEQITPDAFADALDMIPTLAGVKFSSYCIKDLLNLKLKAEGRLNIISGCAEQLLSATVNGAEGSICTWYNIVPRLGVRIRECVAASDLAEAVRLQDLLVRFALALSANHLGCLKFLVAKRGIGVGRPRLPQPRLSSEALQSLWSELEPTGITEWLI